MNNILIVCPYCKKPLNAIDNGYFCNECHQKYDIVDGIPILLNKLNTFKQKESDFHTHIASQADNAHSLASKRVKNLHDSFLKPIKALNLNSIILEIACGSGNDLIDLINCGFVVNGVDISFGMCCITREKIRSQNCTDKAIIYQADAENLPFGPGSFDAVYVSGSLHHFTNLDTIFLEIIRVLKPNGLIVIGSEPNHWQYKLRALKYSYLGKKFLKIFRNDYTIEGGSPADYETLGYNQESFMDIAKKFDLQVILLEPFWYLNGFISLFGLKPSETVEDILISCDNVLGKIPVIKDFSWKWNCIMKIPNKNED